MCIRDSLLLAEHGVRVHIHETAEWEKPEGACTDREPMPERRDSTSASPECAERGSGWMMVGGARVGRARVGGLRVGRPT